MAGQGETVKLFAQLTKWNVRDVANICQTFWGLSDTFPPGSPELFKSELYAPGPLSTSAYASLQLSSPLDLNPLPPANTLAIVCDLFNTVSNLIPAAAGFRAEEGPGDGTVPLWSATANFSLESITVNEKHVTLPIDSRAISATTDKISHWTGLKPRLLLEAGEVNRVFASPPGTRDAFIESLEEMDDKPLTLGTFLSMLFLS
jgi:hypothetical protein